MPAIRYTLSAADYVSDEMRAALRRRIHEIVGALLLGLAGIAAVALATWSVQDPRSVTPPTRRCATCYPLAHRRRPDDAGRHRDHRVPFRSPPGAGA